MLFSCDPQRKSKCEWYIIPFADGHEDVKAGHVSLCVANFDLKRKRCFFSAELDLAERFNGIPFVYNNMEFTETFPKVITQLKPCQK